MQISSKKKTGKFKKNLPAGTNQQIAFNTSMRSENKYLHFILITDQFNYLVRKDAVRSGQNTLSPYCLEQRGRDGTSFSLGSDYTFVYCSRVYLKSECIRHRVLKFVIAPCMLGW